MVDLLMVPRDHDGKVQRHDHHEQREREQQQRRRIVDAERDSRDIEDVSP